MATRNTIAIEVSRRRLGAIHVVASRDSLRVKALVSAEMPADVPHDDADAVGAWLAEQLRAAGIPRGRATFALSRESVAMKRLTFPTDDPCDLPDMVRLSMERELPFDPSDAVIDFMPLTSAGGQTTVLAAAVRGSVVEFTRAMAKAARLGVERVSLRCTGIAALLESITADVDDQRAWLAVDVTGSGAELTVVTDGQIRFSRAAEIAAQPGSTEFTDSVITETKRSWMSYRIVEAAPPVNEAFILGDRELLRAAVDPIAELLGVRASALARHPRVDTGGYDLQSAWALAGLLLEPVLSIETFDFAAPRRAPDVNARKRQLALAGAGAAALAIAATFMFGYRDLRRLQGTADSLAEQVRDQTDDHWRYEREYFRTKHVAAWSQAEANWLEHLRLLHEHLPPRDDLVLDDWSGSLRFQGVAYDRQARDADDRWSAPREAVIKVSGEARTQAVIDAFRESLVRSREYTATPAGPDTQGGRRYPFPFAVSLRTPTTSPAVVDQASGASEAEQAEERIGAESTEDQRGGDNS
jgi:hypothetical protein